MGPALLAALPLGPAQAALVAMEQEMAAPVVVIAAVFN
jgi:hypothetical protein